MASLWRRQVTSQIFKHLRAADFYKAKEKLLSLESDLHLTFTLSFSLPKAGLLLSLWAVQLRRMVPQLVLLRLLHVPAHSCHCLSQSPHSFIHELDVQLSVRPREKRAFHSQQDRSLGLRFKIWDSVLPFRAICINTPKQFFLNAFALTLKYAFDAFYLIRHRPRTTFIIQTRTYFALEVRKKTGTLVQGNAQSEMNPIYVKDY